MLYSIMLLSRKTILRVEIGDSKSNLLVEFCDIVIVSTFSWPGSVNLHSLEKGLAITV